MEKVVYIGPHPDDVDLGCGMSLHKHYSLGDENHIIILSQGEKGGKAEERIIEQEKSVNILAPGSKIYFLNYPDTKFFSCKHEIITEISKIISSIKPTIVYIPTINDFHQDHVVTYESALSCFNSINVNKIISYETPSTTPQFTPNLFKFYEVNQFKIKLEALNCHKTQKSKAYFSEESIFSIAKMRAAQGRFHYGVAEAYEIIRYSEF